MVSFRAGWDILDIVSTTPRKKNATKLDIVSSGSSRTRILDAALALIRKRGSASVTMAEIAQAAKISRQAVYLHFEDRAALLVALVRHLDEGLGLAADIERLKAAPSGVESLRILVELQATRNPKLWAVAEAFDAVRRTDAAAERSWQDRLRDRLEGCRAMVGRMQAEGALRKDVDPDAAADLLWTLTSLRTWEDLVLQRGWSATQYQEYITRVLLDALVL